MTFSEITKFYAFKKPWASADFFQEEGKNIQEGKKQYLPKKHRKTYYFSQKVLKHIIFGRSKDRLDVYG